MTFLQKSHKNLQNHRFTLRPPSPRLCAKPASRPRKMRLSREPVEKNNRLSRREKCGLITEKSIISFQPLKEIRHGHNRRPMPVWYENLSGVVSCPENSNINTDGMDSVVIGSRDQ